MRALIFIFFVFGASLSLAATLTTENYVVTIEVNCSEGNVTCSDVTYKGTSKKSGESITLKGSTWHTWSADGSPNRFLGYMFKNGNVAYRVFDGGRLQVIQKESTVLLDEEGTWEY